jgi:hypothetical protein
MLLVSALSALREKYLKNVTEDTESSPDRYLW